MYYLMEMISESPEGAFRLLTAPSLIYATASQAVSSVTHAALFLLKMQPPLSGR